MSSHRDNYLDFDLLLQRDGARYRARVLRAPSGEAQGTFEVPFNDLELENFLLKIGQPRRGIRRADTPQTQLTREFGSKLFRALFDGDLLGSFRSSLEEAGRQGRGLRLRLHMNETPALAQLPWEYLHNPSLNEFLALGRDTPVIRYLEIARVIPSLLVKSPLRILVIISSPRGVAELNTKDEWGRLSKALAPLQDSRRVVLEQLETASLKTLQKRLQGKDIHVLHFIGHGGFDPTSQDGLLLFEDENKNQVPVSGENLGVLLHNHRPLRLAVVNACDGARSSKDDPFAGVAQSLVRKGLPGVIAMQFEISDDAAIVFAEGFYTALASGYPVDAALVEARTAIYVKQLGAEWGTPVLFMRSPDGRLFDIQPQESTQKESTQGQDSSKEAAQKESMQGDKKVKEETAAGGWLSSELVKWVTSVGQALVLGGLIFVAYKNQFDLAFAVTTLGRASSSVLGLVSLLSAFVGAVAFVLSWKRERLLSNTVRNWAFLALWFGCFGFSITEFLAAEDTFEVNATIKDTNSGQPLSDSKVTLYANDKVVASILSGPDGKLRGVLPPGVYSSNLTAKVAHDGYYTHEVKEPYRLSSGLEITLSPLAPPIFKSTFNFGGLPLNLSWKRDINQFNYGYSSVETDKTVTGEGVRIKSIRIDMRVRAYSELACCDVWVMLSPSPVMFKPGSYSGPDAPHYIHPSPSVAPVQAQFVIGNGGKSLTSGERVSFFATYDFESKQWGGNIDNHTKDFFASPLSLTTGLYAQVFLWNGNPGVNVDVEALSLTVEGTRPNQQ